MIHDTWSMMHDTWYMIHVTPTQFFKGQNQTQRRTMKNHTYFTMNAEISKTFQLRREKKTWMFLCNKLTNKPQTIERWFCSIPSVQRRSWWRLKGNVYLAKKQCCALIILLIHCTFAQVATFCLFPLFKKSCAGASTYGNWHLHCSRHVLIAPIIEIFQTKLSHFV